MTVVTQDEIDAANALADGFEWAIVEIFGHRRHVGRSREEERFGSKMLRIDVPTFEPDGKTIIWASHFYGGSSIFSYTPTDEATVMKYAERRYATPAIPYSAQVDDDATFAGPGGEDDHEDGEDD